MDCDVHRTEDVLWTLAISVVIGIRDVICCSCASSCISYYVQLQCISCILYVGHGIAMSPFLCNS